MPAFQCEVRGHGQCGTQHHASQCSRRSSRCSTEEESSNGAAARVHQESLLTVLGRQALAEIGHGAEVEEGAEAEFHGDVARGAGERSMIESGESAADSRSYGRAEQRAGHDPLTTEMTVGGSGRRRGCSG